MPMPRLIREGSIAGPSALDGVIRRVERTGMKTTACLLLALVPLCLGGCGLYKWQKPGADDAAFKADASVCEQQSRDGFDACMRGRGWTLDS
jgi:hypothetical protein